jgi:hypothetical protein
VLIRKNMVEQWKSGVAAAEEVTTCDSAPTRCSSISGIFSKEVDYSDLRCVATLDRATNIV